MMVEISIQNLSKSFGNFKALDSVTLEFQDKGLFALLGPSGSGKTTLLRAIAGFSDVDSGSILMDGESVEHVRVENRDIGIMFQNYALFPNMTVADNIGFGLRVRKFQKSEERKKVHEALELIQLDGFGHRMPHELSGGQQQRVALARAFVTNPKVLLLDEPLSALDKALRVDMQTELKRIQREIGITTIFVTHDQEEALSLADRIGILHQGKLVQAGLPRQVYNSPHNLFVAKFLGDINLFNGQLKEDRMKLKNGAEIRAPQKTDSSHVLAIRPEHMSITVSAPTDSETDSVSGILLQRTFKGSNTHCVIDCEGEQIKVLAREAEIPDVQDMSRVFVSWKANKLMAIPSN